MSTAKRSLRRPPRRGLAPQALTDRVAERFLATWARLGISNDQFMRTTAIEHREGVRALIERIFERSPDDFYQKTYAGWYCVGCEAFKTQAEIVDGRCVLHPTRTLEWVEERNWFFRLSRTRTSCAPTSPSTRSSWRPRVAATRSWRCSTGAGGHSASRARLAWGIPFPRPDLGRRVQTTYVWFDALPNYLTATGFPADGYTRAMAGAAPRHRQRHYPLPLCDLAGHAPIGRASTARARVGPRVRDAGGRRAIQ